MRILLSAYACEPGTGSEPAVGWHWALQAARHHDVWVLTRANNRDAIERALARDPVPRLHFLYHDLPPWVLRAKRTVLGTRGYYVLWQLTALRSARRHHRRVGFDLAHHVTLVSFRYPTFLAWLGVPYVFGPVGGGERAPRAFLRMGGWRGLLQESLRNISTALAAYDPFVRASLRRARLVLAANPATAAALPADLASRVSIVPAVGGNPADVTRPGRAGTSLHLLYVGNLQYLKGLQLALPALARARGRGGDICLTIVGAGPYRPYLERQVAALGLAGVVDFRGRLPYPEVQQLYGAHDALVFPSLRDSGGFAVVEAMSHALPVVCLAIGGPALLVTDETGVRVPAVTPGQTVDDLANAMLLLSELPALRDRMGAAGRRRVIEHLAWDRKGDLLRTMYHALRD